MNIRLGENIKAFRKERNMTQEQLADALGVTVGAVYKWESKASMPEIRLLLELADLFGASVDALLGYEMQSSSVDDIIERIHEHMRRKDYTQAVSDAEKALFLHPNNFRLICCCFEVFQRRGIETGDKESLLRAIDLMERAIPLLSQNDSPEISEYTIRSDIAICYIKSGQVRKGLEILKKFNTGGINNSMIGITYTMPDTFDRCGAEQYIMKSLVGSVTGIIRSMTGYVNYHSHLHNYADALDASLWLIDFLFSLKADKSRTFYFDKLISLYYGACAGLSDHLGKQPEADEYLNKAFQTAAAFDADPVYCMTNTRFAAGEIKNTVASDDTGATAIAAIEYSMVFEIWSDSLKSRWQQLKEEKQRKDVIHEE